MCPDSVIALCLMMFVLMITQVRATHYVSYVNTRIGSGTQIGGNGNTFPATGVPYANTFMSPQTQPKETKCIAPYYSWDTMMSGVRASHFLSGGCMQDYGSLTVMPMRSLPTTGTSESDYASPFDNGTMVSAPHLFSVHLTRDDIYVEATGTSHCGVVRIHFPSTASRGFLVLKPNSDAGQGAVSYDPSTGDMTITNPAHRIYAQWGQSAGFAGNYIVKISSSLRSCGVFDGNTIRNDTCTIQATGQSVAAFLEVELPPSKNVTVTMCNSFTSIVNAKANAENEISEKTFDDVVTLAEATWEGFLGSVALDITQTSQDTLVKFYTAMYHTLLHPREFGDSTPGHDHVKFDSRSLLNSTIVQTPNKYFDDFSMWDTFRVVQPWISLASPTTFTDITRSLIEKYRNSQWMPKFPMWNSFTSEMIGDHAIVVLIDAISKGLFPETDGFSAREVFEAGVKNAFQVPTLNESLDGKGRIAAGTYNEYGFLPVDIPTGKNQQVSMTVEYAYDDYVLAQLAARYDSNISLALLKRSDAAWRTLLDTTSSGGGYMRGKYKNGSWVTPFDPFSRPTWITEASPFEYTWFVLQDVPALIEVLGGPEAFIRKLDMFFDGGYYDPGNEPDIQVPYFYNYAAQPWRTQYWIRNLSLTQYGTGPNGLPGNDDSGAMSAWYLFAVVGFYPVCHGGGPELKPKYILGAPQAAKIQLQNLTILATGISDVNMYIQRATWDGAPYDRSWVYHADVAERGGILEFTMGPLPNKTWGIANIPTGC